MRYDKLILAPGGEEFPFAEHLEDGEYQYWISVVWDERDGELYISRDGAHIEFDDDGSWLDFHTSPSAIFPSAQFLTESDLLALMDSLSDRAHSASVYSLEQVQTKYEMFHRLRKGKTV